MTIHLDCTLPISLAEFVFGELHSFFLISMGEFLDLINKTRIIILGMTTLMTFLTQLLVTLRKMTSKMEMILKTNLAS